MIHPSAFALTFFLAVGTPPVPSLAQASADTSVPRASPPASVSRASPDASASRASPDTYALRASPPASVSRASPGADAAGAPRGLYAVGLGWFDLVQGKDEALDVRLEYRAATALWRLRPWAGLEATTDQAVYLLAGLRFERSLGRRLVITLSSGGGLFAEGDGKRLNFPLEFRSQVEAALRLGSRSRLALAFGHISNASLGKPNPGTEVLVLYYCVTGSG